MQVWKTILRVYQVSNQTRTRCLVGLNELYFPTVCYAQHICTRTFFYPRDPVLRSDKRFSSNKLKNTFATNRTEIHKSTKSQRRSSQAAPFSKTEKKLSSELQKLRFEDLSESESGRIRKDSQPNQDKEFEIVFGVAPCLLALTQGKRSVRCLFVKSGEGPERDAILRVCQEAIRRGVQIKRVNKQTLEKMCDGKVHQGLCLQASCLGFIKEEEEPITSLEMKNQRPLWLVLDGVQDPMNLGAILRSAYYLGVDRVVSSINKSCPLTPTVSKASAGVMEVMNVFGCSNLKHMIKVKVEEGWQVVGTVGLEEGNFQSNVMPCSDFKMSRPTLLLMGGEGDGLSPELRQLCDVLITIPPRRHMHPGVESLNVSVATGILLHSLLSTRKGNC